jgi:hypothetical protein
MVPDLSCGIAFHLSRVGFSQTDDAAFNRFLSRAVNEHHDHDYDAQADIAQRDHAGLVILAALVRSHHGSLPFKAHGIQH